MVSRQGARSPRRSLALPRLKALPCPANPRARPRQLSAPLMARAFLVGALVALAALGAVA